MNESTFISANKSKWQELEDLLESKVRDPDKLHELFIKVSSDLSYARTFYPNRTVRLYLNNLTQRVLDLIQSRQNKFSLSTLRTYYAHTLPRELWRARYAFLVSFLIFSIAVAIGALSTANDLDFTRVILGDQYVDMTDKNINDGDPMAVYKATAQVEMFWGITLNNIKVAFIAFIIGLFGSIGTVIVLLSNGIMLGSFQYYFYQKGLFLTSFLTIWIHGTIEISAIIIAGGAGLVLGDGLLNPKTFSRSLSLQVASKRAVRILLSTIPLFIIAGFLESYVTRLTEAPVILKIGIIGLSLAFIVYHYIIHPKMYQARNIEEEDDYRVQPSQLEEIITVKKRYSSFSEISEVSFAQFRYHLGSILYRAIFPILVSVIIIYWAWAKYGELMQIDYSSSFILSEALFNAEIGGWQLFLLYELCIVHIMLVTSMAYQNLTMSMSQYLNLLRSHALVIILLTLPYLLMFYNFTLWPTILFCLFFPPQIIFSTLYECTFQNQSLIIAFQKALSKSYNRYPDYIKSFLLCSFIYYMLLLVVSMISALLFTDFISWHNLFPGYINNSVYIGSIFSIMFSCIAYTLFHFMYSNMHISLDCKEESHDLFTRIELLDLSRNDEA